jgi:hypothetical protein
VAVAGTSNSRFSQALQRIVTHAPELNVVNEAPAKASGRNRDF